MKKQLFLSTLLSILFLSVLNANATPMTISSDPLSVDFFIPLTFNASGTFGQPRNDGTALAGQSPDTVTLKPGKTASGYLDLSLKFTPIPADLTYAKLFMSFQDLDLLPSTFWKVTFFETARIMSGGTVIADLNETYANNNGITVTNNTQTDFMFNLVPTLFPSLPDPFILDLRLRTELTNNGWWEKTFTNTQESILSAHLEVTPVPESSTLLLFGSGLAGMFVFRKKIRKNNYSVGLSYLIHHKPPAKPEA